MESNTKSDGAPRKIVLEDLTQEELVVKCKGLLAIAHKAKQSKCESQNEIENYKKQLQKFEAEKSSNLENIKTLQELVDSLTEQKLNYITEIDASQNKIRTLNEKCNKLEEEIELFRTNYHESEKNVIDARQKLSDIDIENISLKRQNTRLIEENEQLLGQLTELETQNFEFKNIALQQREQLQKLEDNVQTANIYKTTIEDLNKKIQQLEQKFTDTGTNAVDALEYESKIKELSELYENEKSKKEKANIKLRSYKDKILKCATCINQLKNSRFILTKTVKEYSESIPRWQDDIIKASNVLDAQVNELNIQNATLKERIKLLEEEINQREHNISEIKGKNHELETQLYHIQEQIHHLSSHNSTLNEELEDIKQKYKEVKENDLSLQINKNQVLQDKIVELNERLNSYIENKSELNKLLENLKRENQMLKNSLQCKGNDNEVNEKLSLQIKALESEKATLVKEKLNARDNVTELENQNKQLIDYIDKLKLEIQTLKARLDTLAQEKSILENNVIKDKEGDINILKFEINRLEEQNSLLKKEYDDLQDLNGLLKEEVETLKLSLEQPKDDTENLSDLNVSLQADIVKLETKLSAYKQENASLLAEVKESRTKIKDIDALVLEYEDCKSNLLNYKTENTELLNEMKEINQVLKERGESISKQQKAIAEMERLVETLEKDRDDAKRGKEELSETVELLKIELKNAEQNTNKNNERIDQIVTERDNALKSLNEKEAYISSVKDEIEKLKQHQTSSGELPNEDMSTSTISKAEEHSRMKDLDETFEEKYTKLRIFALKLKKKLNDTTAQLQTTLQEKAKIEKMLNENTVNKEQRQDDVYCINANPQEATKTYENELKMEIKSLAAAVEASKRTTADLERVKAELEIKTHELLAEREAHKATKENLEKARRDVKKNNVLSLEMEDYERSMKELSTKMDETKKKMLQMESTIDTQKGTITAMMTQKKLLEEQVKTEETQIRLLKEDLQHMLEEMKEKDNIIHMKVNIIKKLEQDLEDEKRKNEESNIETTALLSDKENIIIALGEEKTDLNNKLKKIEFKCGELTEKLKVTNIELEDLKTEYTSYKVRAQAVLRQNQMVDHSQEEQLKEETAVLRTQIEKLTAKLATAEEQCSALTAEAAAATRRASEANAESARAQQRTARLHTELTRLQQQLENERSHHALQNSTLNQCYKTQISDLEAKIQKMTEDFRQQLARETEKTKLKTVVDDANRNQYMLPVIPKEEGSDGEMDINVSMIPREEGEGSESAPTPPLAKAYLPSAGGSRSPVPLERLLEEGVPEDEALDTSSLAFTPEQEISDLKRKLQAQQQRVKHITMLLSESERECARMAQLSELLKGELRRVRGDHAQHNTEYMKNVTLKFLTLPPGDERSRLVPVLQKILTLTSDETHKIQAVAKGIDPNSRGWGSYLPWPGGK